MTGPFVVIWCSLPLRKALAQDHAGILRFAPAPLAAQRFDTEELAQEAIATTVASQAPYGDPGGQEYLVLPLATWEDEQEAQTKRDQEREARAKERKRAKAKATEEAEA